MSKNKGKKNKNKREVNKANTKICVDLSEHVSSEEIKRIIVDALLEVEGAKKQREQEQRQEKLKEWQNMLGYKDYSESKWYIRWLLQFINGIKVMAKWSFLSKDKIEGVTATSILIKVSISLFFKVLEWGLNIISLLLVSLLLILCVTRYIDQLSLGQWIGSLELLIVAFIFSRIFRMASIEVEKNEDYGFLIGVFASVMSVVSIAIAIIAIVR